MKVLVVTVPLVNDFAVEGSQTINLSLNQPAEYERIVSSAHVGIAGFGGAFLAMVGLKFFFDQDRKKTLESRVSGLAKVVYHNKLGTQGERGERVRLIARAIALRWADARGRLAALGADAATLDSVIVADGRDRRVSAKPRKSMKAKLNNSIAAFTTHRY